MIYLKANSEEYNYDVRAITLAFFERETIRPLDMPLTQIAEREDGSERIMLMTIEYGQGRIDGSISELIIDPDAADREKNTVRKDKTVSRQVVCDYLDHGKNRNKVCRFLYSLLSDFTGRTLPWGMLTGIRPSKIMMAWLEEESDPRVLDERFCRTYLADSQKAALCRNVAQREKEILSGHDYQSEYSIYIGIPFCPTTCLYCSFTSFPASRFGDRMGPYLDALEKELTYVASAMGDRPISSIYIGGGTPTALSADYLKRLMDMVHASFPVSSVAEFTVEAGRPDSVNKEKFAILRKAGVSRISINPQTMHQETLDLIGRAHTVEDTVNAFCLAREEGFDNINMDIITGLPGEGLSHIRQTLEKIRNLRPESLTVHSLAIKRAANLNIEMEKYRSLVKGSTNEMLRLVDETASDMEMRPYYMYRQKNIPGNLENIGYAVPGRECLYNILMMEEKQDIISCGAGASSKYLFPRENRIERTENVKNLDHYIRRIDEMIDRKRAYLS